MSELKAYIAPTPDGTGLADYYLKSEADKVIAELKMKLAAAQQVLRYNKPEALYSNLETMSRLTHEKYVVERRERHQKYKRCLAMAKWCAACRFAWSFMPDDDEVKDKCKFYEKWKRRWEVLAKEPTWTKFLQLIHKEAK